MNSNSGISNIEDILSQVPWNLIIPILVLQFILMIVALISCIRSEATNGSKVMWVIIIVFVNLIGPILYFVIGRRSN